MTFFIFLRYRYLFIDNQLAGLLHQGQLAKLLR